MYTNIHIYTNTNDLQKKEELRPGVDPHQDCFLMYTNIHISTITNNLQKKEESRPGVAPPQDCSSFSMVTSPGSGVCLVVQMIRPMFNSQIV